jgi:N-acylneuraminate cytidylyltransferase
MSEQSLAIIPARGGSKRILRKNIKSFLGIPVIKYSIDAAIASNCFDEVMVSTDDKEIAEISISYGASVPFYRSEATSNDKAGTAEAIEEVLMEYVKRAIEFEYFCCIYPAAPFITSERLKEAMELLKKTGAESVVSVACSGYPVQRSLKIEDGRLKMIWPENYNVRSQDLMPVYHDCGQFYWMKTRSLLKQKKLFADYTIPFIISELESQDIDSEEDWKIAETKYKILRLGEGYI